MTFIEGPLLRKFNLSIFRVETAGRSGSKSSEMEPVGIEDAHIYSETWYLRKEKRSRTKKCQEQ
jgi:hypothetical protein